MLLEKVDEADIVIAKAKLIVEVRTCLNKIMEVKKYGIGHPFNEVGDGDDGERFNRIDGLLIGLKDDVMSLLKRFEADVAGWKPIPEKSSSVEDFPPY